MLKRLTIALASLIAAPSFAEEITLRFQYFVSAQSANPTYFMEPWAERIKEQSGGRLKIELYPMMQLGGSAANQFDLIRDGAIDGGWVIPSYQPGRFPEVEALELPFMTTKSAEQASAAAWTYTQQHLLDDFKDVHLIAAHMHGRGIIHKKGPPIATIDDFDGLKLRGPSRPITLLLEQLGAEPIGMPVPAFPEALARGVLDGGVITWEMSPSLKLDELTDSHTDVSGDRALYNLYFIWAMNKDSYASLPADLRAIIDANSGFEASLLAGRAHDIGDALGMEEMAEVNQVAVMPEQVTQQIRQAAQSVEADWVAEMDKRGFDGAQLLSDAKSAVDDYRELPDRPARD